MIEDISTKFM
jgi:hypothetical protein